MSSLFKVKVVRYVDDHGRRVKKDAPGAKAKSEESTKWYGEYKDACGITRRVPLFADKSASQIKLADIVKTVERQMAGIADPFEQHSSRTLLDHLGDYELHLRSKSGTEAHVKQVIYRIRRIAEACKFHRLEDVDGTRVAHWLAERRKTVKRFSAQTSNFYCDAMK